MLRHPLRQKIIHLIRRRPPTHDPLTVSDLAKKFRTSKEKMAKAVFQLFTEKKLEIYGQLVLPKNPKRPR